MGLPRAGDLFRAFEFITPAGPAVTVPGMYHVSYNAHLRAETSKALALAGEDVSSA